MPEDEPFVDDAEALYELLVEQKVEQTGIGFSRAGERALRCLGRNGFRGGFRGHAVEGLEFSEEHFGTLNPQAVSCRVCGGLFMDDLLAMRRHRLQCGWK